MANEKMLSFSIINGLFFVNMLKFIFIYLFI